LPAIGDTAADGEEREQLVRAVVASASRGSARNAREDVMAGRM
jgi:hypothetical protein